MLSTIGFRSSGFRQTSAVRRAWRGGRSCAVSREPKADGDDMPDALLVLNAGSSSLKFSVFLAGDPPQPVLTGQLEGLLTQPRFRARDATAVVGEKEWPAGTRLGHQGAIEFLFAWGRDGVFGGHRIVAVGHRVVHGGVRFSAPRR